MHRSPGECGRAPGGQVPPAHYPPATGSGLSGTRAAALPATAAGSVFVSAASDPGAAANHAPIPAAAAGAAAAAVHLQPEHGHLLHGEVGRDRVPAVFQVNQGDCARKKDFIVIAGFYSSKAKGLEYKTRRGCKTKSLYNNNDFILEKENEFRSIGIVTCCRF